MMRVDEEKVEQLCAMGFDGADVRLALQKFNNNVEKAMNSLLGEPDDDDSNPPPLISADNPPPYGPEPYTSNINYSMQPDNKLIDLTADSDTENSSAGTKTGGGQKLLCAPPNSMHKEDADLERALKESVGQMGLHNDDDEVGKAMEASMASLVSVEEDGWIGSPEKRKRVMDGRPPMVRALSPHFSGFSAYIQCLYALPIWRNAILNFRPSEDEMPGCTGRDYRGFWKGGKNASPARLNDASFQRIYALQRLFSLMNETKRSFLHLTELVEICELREIDWKFGDDWTGIIKNLHEQLSKDYADCVTTKLTVMVSKGEISTEEMKVEQAEASKLFSGTGLEVPNNEHINLPLPAQQPAVFQMIGITVSQTGPKSFYQALDRQLVTPGDDDDQSYSLVSIHPTSLAIQINREHDYSSFGESKDGKAFKVEPTLFLDRYSVKNRAKIQEKRKALRELRAKEEESKAKRKELAETKEGKVAVNLVQTTLTYLKQATSEDPERQERQTKLAEMYQIVADRLNAKITELEGEIAAQEKEADELFTTSEFSNYGPYELHAILMRNGLNGRGSTWSVVKDEEGRWWKISDLDQTEVTLEEALSDPSGQKMRAGATFAFYNLMKDPIAPGAPPLQLKDAADRDNEAFERELQGFPPEEDDLPASLEEHFNSTDGRRSSLNDGEKSRFFDHRMQDEETTVVDPLLIDLNDGDVPETPATEIVIEDGEDLMETSEAPSRTSSPMALDTQEEIDELATIPSDSEETLRLRGGADDGMEVDGEDEDDYDDEEIDEDEVELGCLKPMEDGWNIDLAVGKVGGLPRWLDPSSPLTRKDVACGVCASPMPLLLQLNSPDDERPHASARTLYVFACRNKDCRASGSLSTKVWRVQMPSPNAFFPATPESEARRKALGDRLDVSTNLVDSAPSGSREVQPFAEWDIACEPEPYEESYLDDPAKTTAADGEEGGEDAAEPDTATGVDRAFLIFQERVERLPEQVLRFYRLPGVEDPEPLWVSSKKVKADETTPCPLCHGPRKVEFQILSTILGALKDDDFNFDSFLVYTCASNCPIASLPPHPGFDGDDRSGWAQELLVEQSFASDGVKFGQ
ncbi:programmed cell death protein 2 [Pseudohyphozyma bogoriensis]|nr:programmed cell death protein 2 [Pseudohyphozyma bogoriensis]